MFEGLEAFMQYLRPRPSKKDLTPIGIIIALFDGSQKLLLCKLKKLESRGCSGHTENPFLSVLPRRKSEISTGAILI